MSTSGAPPSASDALSFFRLVGKLKELKRTGWVYRGVHLPESVADHMYRMAVCSFMVVDPAIDRSRVMKIALVHDLAEALAGDIAPHQGVTDADKRRMEEEALDAICQQIGSDAIGREIKDLWLEYEDCVTPEAQTVKDLDKFEMIVQADEYERAQDKDLSEFFHSTKGCFRTTQVKAWDAELRGQRDARRNEESLAAAAGANTPPPAHPGHNT